MFRLRTILIALVLGSSLVSAAAIHLVWWRTATRNSADLATTLERQIAGAVQREWWAVVTGAEGAYAVAEKLFRDPDPPNRALALTAALQSGNVLSALVHIDPDGAGMAAVLSRKGIASIAPEKISRDKMAQSWATAQQKPAPGWVSVSADPVNGQPAVAYVGRLQDGGTLGAFMDLSRFSQLLGGISVGATGAAFVIEATGQVAIAPTSSAVNIEALASAAKLAGNSIAPQADDNQSAFMRVEHDGEAYAVTLASLYFQGWRLAIVLPEAEFLGDVNRTTRRVAIGLTAFVLLASLIAMIIARRSLGTPIGALAGDVALIERFAFDDITHRKARVVEIDQLSAAIARMAAALSDFGKYIPRDLVRRLIADGIRAEPGGKTRQITILFADIAGFTGLSERLGTGVIDLVSRYLDVASRAIVAESGTVDKYIGDAVMALWGAPRGNADHALHACYGALGMLAEVGAIGLADDRGQPLRIRIGIHSGSAIVGNIGSPDRLNYTAIGDSVNLASRLEGANKLYGTAIMISEATRTEAGEAIVAREIDRIAVLGRMGGVAVFELLGRAAEMQRPDWVAVYEDGLASYRARAFADALARFEQVLDLRPGDGPATVLADRCRAYMASPPAEEWNGVYALDGK